MPEAVTAALAGHRSQAARAERASASLAALVYRSRAVRPLSPPELQALTSVSQARNRREAITGLMLYDNDRFFQWLEGPADGVDRVMDSIRADPRHTDVEVLDAKPARARAFADWSMKLATPVPIMTAWRREVIEPPRDIVEGLRTRPEAAPSLLVKLVPPSARAAQPVPADELSHLPLGRKTAAILRTVFLASVLPHLRQSDAAVARPTMPSPDRRALELAELLIATDQAAAADLLEELLESGGTIGERSATLFEPAARRLGDLWSEDSCSEFDVTIGLCRLQTAARLLTAGSRQARPSRLPQPMVLIATEPGELHRLGAALDRSVLQDAGWAPHCEFPTDNQALEDLLSSTWFDALDLSLSTAFRREHTLSQVTETIAQARRASRNPGLAVVVGGRVFAEQGMAGAIVGADHASTTALNVNRSILRTITAARTKTATPGEVATAS